MLVPLGATSKRIVGPVGDRAVKVCWLVRAWPQGMCRVEACPTRKGPAPLPGAGSGSYQRSARAHLDARGAEEQTTDDDGGGCRQVNADSRMDWGLLWFDDNRKKAFAARVKRAAQQYRRKFGRAPDTCYVHPNTLSGEDTMPKGIDVVQSTLIQPDHFWIGSRSGSH